jgi:hypothetical protein
MTKKDFEQRWQFILTEGGQIAEKFRGRFHKTTHSLHHETIRLLFSDRFVVVQHVCVNLHFR